MNYKIQTENTSTSPCLSKLAKECSSPLYKIPVFLSHPSRLNTTQQQFVDAIILKIREALLFLNNILKHH